MANFQHSANFHFPMSESSPSVVNLYYSKIIGIKVPALFSRNFGTTGTNLRYEHVNASESYVLTM